MKSLMLIAHRGNLDGPNPSQENDPSYIEHAITKGFDVEIDLWLLDNKLYLGHDEPQYNVSTAWINKYTRQSLWIHCKNFGALYACINETFDHANYFWHQEDDFTLTSKNYIWTYPGGKVASRSIVLLPERDLNWISMPKNINSFGEAAGVCSDYVGRISSI